MVTSPASAPAHDIYTPLRTARGQLCCGGDPVTGDCEAVFYRPLPGGDVLITSLRYRSQIRVGRDHISWMRVPGGEDSEAHWCGRPRAHFVYGPYLPPNADQPDPGFWTYCAFIAPGGV